MSSAIEVLKNMQLEQIELDKRDELRAAFYRARLGALGEAIVALEQKEKLSELLADFALTLYKPNEIILNDSFAGGNGKTKEGLIKKAEMFLNGKN